MATVHAPAPFQALNSSVLGPVVSDGLKRPLEVTSLPPGAVLSQSPSFSSVELEPLSKKTKQQQYQFVVSSDDEAGASSDNAIAKKKKKPQMKYDPDVPMTKEEATAWRREQRRKRNRESAAASRQRQRDRITELEAEVDQYKKAYDAVQAQIKALEDQDKQPRSETPEPVPSILITQPVSPTTSTFLDLNAGDGILDKPTLLPAESFSQEQQLQQPLKMISRHAVKITGDEAVASFENDNVAEDSVVSAIPEPVASTAMNNGEDEWMDMDDLLQTLDPMESSLLATEEPLIDPDLGEFLMDAVDWLS